ncbi:hypothetical protein C2E25_08275 [Geothermobacter hydrogeniphilus]|uniref:Uncharacterized protein n=1 Tax=Geothermobacter hydrogeniphilus TaxID=1969733 RepID=A0A2K2HAG4_9BACT|nr:oligosaccharide flippase family protein [Geothermobacter hydrogeniphilus]PNU20292.1 hypothetical protein C2E25_08275 [Geothermobacter hydrogeniphilus]
MINDIRKKTSRLWADQHMREVLRGSAVALVLRVAGVGLAFGFNIAIARLLGAEGAGLYFLALSISTIGSVVGRVGLDNALLRFVATHSATDDWAKVKGVYALGIRIAILGLGFLSLLGFWFAPWLAAMLFDKPDLGDPLRWMCLTILPFGLLNLQAESLKGVKWIRDAMLVQGVGVPFLGLLTIWPLARFSGVTGAVWAYLLAVVLTAMLGQWAWTRAVVARDVPASPYSFAVLWKSCKPLLVTSVMNRAILPWAPLFLLGLWAPSAEVGIFGAANRVAMLVSFMLVTVNNILAPKFAELYARGDLEALGTTARRSALIITLVSCPVFAVLILGGHWVMGFFGDDFGRGAVVLAILALGQLVNTLTGSVGFILISTGHEIDLRNISIASGVAQVVACLVLNPFMGMYGAALATAVAIAGNNLVASYLVWRRLGIIVSPLARRIR